MSDHEVPGGALDERIHLADLARQGLLVEQAIGHIPVKGIERAETISGIRPAQILLHFPDHATPRHDERIVDLPRECHTLFAIERTIAAKHGKRIEPHGEIVEILAVAVRLLADADAARPPEHAIDLGHQSFGLIEITFVARRLIERYEKHDTERIGPQIAQAVRPDPLLAHPGELVDRVSSVAQPTHCSPRPPWSDT